MRTGRGVCAAVALAVGGCLAAGSASAAQPAPSTSITAGFVPNKLGASATVELGFRLGESTQAPRQLVGVNFLLPTGVDMTTSELGLTTCSRRTLMGAGSAGCQPEAVMGYGKAVILAPDAVEALVESVGLTVLMAPAEDRHTTILFYASGDSPVIAQMVFSGRLSEAAGPYGPVFDIRVPPIAGLPGEPDARVVRMHSSIGSKGVTYYKRVRGRRVAYHPRGMLVPRHCPAGGFPFAATFEYAEGSKEFVSIRAPCPARGGRFHRPRGRPR